MGAILHKAAAPSLHYPKPFVAAFPFHIPIAKRPGELSVPCLDPAQRQATESTGEKGRVDIDFASFCEPGSLASGSSRMCITDHFVN